MSATNHVDRPTAAPPSPERPTAPRPGGFIQGHPVLAYYVLTFAISWGGMLLVGGPGLLAGTDWQTDPLFPVAILLMLVGPPVAGVLLTAVVAGKAGLRDLLARLLRWQVGARWYAVALLTAPLVATAAFPAIWPLAPDYLPTIVTADDKGSVLLAGLTVGLIGGLVEELGWTGFAIPRLLQRHRILVTGLIVGVLWGVWHLLQMLWVGRASAAEVPLAVFMALYISSSIANLTAYRVLMVWVYEGTGSLLVAVLMHASLIATTLFILAAPPTGALFLAYSWLLTAAMWLVVAVVALASGGQLARPPLQRQAA
jgi:membrane protease YdiL (CAAX protease family)